MDEPRKLTTYPVPRPRVSEHTDAARLEAVRDSMRPRVEGEAENLSLLTDDEMRRAIATAPHGADLAILTAMTADRNHWRNGYDQLQKSFDDLWARLNAELAHTTRLTAEVERLRGVIAEAVALAGEAVALCEDCGGTGYIWVDEEEEDNCGCGFYHSEREIERRNEIAARLAALALPTPAPERDDG